MDKNALTDSASGRPVVGRWRDPLALVALYTLAHGLLLIDQGVYFDDWFLYRIPASVTLTNIGNAGTYPFALLHYWLGRPSFTVGLTNAFTFGTYLASGLLVWDIFRRWPGLTRAEAWMLSALVLVLPMNLARNAMVNDQYAACQLLFWLGAWVFQTNEHRPRRAPGLTVLSAALFFGAFLTKSYLVFFVLVLLYALWYRRPASLGAVVREALRLAPWLLLPLVFWLIRLRYMMPKGMAAAVRYNAITTTGLLDVPRQTALTFYFSFVKLLAVTPLALRSWVIAVLALLGGGAVLWWARRSWWPLTTAVPQRRRAAYAGLVGVAAFVAGAFPYLAAGHLPTQNEWSDRHQLLLPFGAAAMLVFGLQWVATWFSPQAGRRLLTVALPALLILCVARNLRLYLDYERDWLKQVSISRQLQTLPELQTATTFLVDDEARSLNAFDRFYRHYEFGGMLWQLFGHDRWLLITSDVYEEMLADSVGGLRAMAGRPDELLGEYHLRAPQHRLIITPGTAVSDADLLLRTLRGPVTDSPATPFVRLRVAPVAAAAGH